MSDDFKPRKILEIRDFLWKNRINSDFGVLKLSSGQDSRINKQTYNLKRRDPFRVLPRDLLNYILKFLTSIEIEVLYRSSAYFRDFLKYHENKSYQTLTIRKIARLNKLRFFGQVDLNDISTYEYPLDQIRGAGFEKYDLKKYQQKARRVPYTYKFRFKARMRRFSRCTFLMGFPTVLGCIGLIIAGRACITCNSDLSLALVIMGSLILAISATLCLLSFFCVIILSL